MMRFLSLLAGAICFSGIGGTGLGALRDDADLALRQGVEFFRTRVAVHGTYLWQYSDDLGQREGETKATATQGWVQPPGTPAVGLAYLTAWKATGQTNFLEAARETARGLMRGQLRSGGWTYSIDFSPEGRSKAAYRDGEETKGRNVTTLDDDTTQSALRFLMQTDEALRFEDPQLREAIDYALNALLAAQYPNGAWPQGFDGPPDPGSHSVKPATFPEDWPRVWPGSRNYWLQYTLNDNSLATTVETLFAAGRIYGGRTAGRILNELAARCRAAARKAGDFLLLARLPEPQPAWAQQYNFEMRPAWARKFEPPAISGGESQGVLRLLLLLFRETGERKFLDPIPRSLEYLRQSRLPDGRLARFYELRSNKPLYFTRDYSLTYDDRDVPTHYAFKVTDQTEAIRREYERVKDLSAAELAASAIREDKRGEDRVAEVKAIVAAQDARGAWSEDGRLRSAGATGTSGGAKVIRSATFIRNVETLSRYLEASRP